VQEGMSQLIAKRVGMEVFIDKLGNVSKQEIYARTAKHPQLHASSASQLLLDHEFCKLFKALEGRSLQEFYLIYSRDMMIFD